MTRSKSSQKGRLKTSFEGHRSNRPEWLNSSAIWSEFVDGSARYRNKIVQALNLKPLEHLTFVNIGFCVLWDSDADKLIKTQGNKDQQLLQGSEAELAEERNDLVAQVQSREVKQG
jgi:hypothetical protein